MKGHGVFPTAEEKQFLQGDVCVEGESRNAARALWTVSWELTTGAKQ